MIKPMSMECWYNYIFIGFRRVVVLKKYCTYRNQSTIFILKNLCSSFPKIIHSLYRIEAMLCSIRAYSFHTCASFVCNLGSVLKTSLVIWSSSHRHALAPLGDFMGTGVVWSFMKRWTIRFHSHWMPDPLFNWDETVCVISETFTLNNNSTTIIWFTRDLCCRNHSQLIADYCFHRFRFPSFHWYITIVEWQNK